MQVDLVAVDEMTDAIRSYSSERSKSRGNSFQAVDLEEIDKALESMEVHKKNVVDDTRTPEGILTLNSFLSFLEHIVRSICIWCTSFTVSILFIIYSIFFSVPLLLVDDIAISEAIAQMESELNTERKPRSNSMMDSVAEMDLDAMDESLKGMKRGRRNSADLDAAVAARTPEGKYKEESR